MRKLATFVRCFIRPTSARKICRPRAVNRYACLPRELSSSLNRSIQRSSSSRRSAPYSVPVLNVTRPSLISSTFFKIEYPWRGCSAKLTKISKTCSLNGSNSILLVTTCRHTPYCAHATPLSTKSFVVADSLDRLLLECGGSPPLCRTPQRIAGCPRYRFCTWVLGFLFAFVAAALRRHLSPVVGTPSPTGSRRDVPGLSTFSSLTSPLPCRLSLTRNIRPLAFV
jgi:hypothetical protein